MPGGLPPGGVAPAPVPAGPRPVGAPAKPNPQIKRGDPKTIVSLKTAMSLPANNAAIRAFVDTEMAAISTGDPGTLRAARMALIEHASNGNAAASPAYQAAYTAAVNEFARKQNKSLEARVRVAIAVVVHGVAARTSTANLLPAVMDALNDPSEAVNIWGVKTARYVVPTLLADASPNGASALNGLAATLIAKLKAQPGSHEVFDDAIDALFGEAAQGTDSPTAAARRKRLIPIAIAWLQARAEMYSAVDPKQAPAAQDIFPASPDAETKSPYPNLLVLVSYRAWPELTPEQKAQAGQAIFDMVEALSKVAPLAPGKQSGEPVTGLSQQELMALLKSYAGGLTVITESSKDPNAVAAVRALVQAIAQMNVAGMQQNLAALKDELTRLKFIGSRAVLTVPVATPPASLPGTRPATTRPATTRPGVVTTPRPGTASR
jgi:hypothetical protein